MKIKTINILHRFPGNCIGFWGPFRSAQEQKRAGYSQPSFGTPGLSFLPLENGSQLRNLHQHFLIAAHQGLKPENDPSLP
jgi:hypothetical protein